MRAQRNSLGLWRRLSASPLGKLPDQFPLALNERFLLGPTPALDLSLRRDCVGDPVEMVRPYQLNRPTRLYVTSGIRADLVFGDALR